MVTRRCNGRSTAESTPPAARVYRVIGLRDISRCSRCRRVFISGKLGRFFVSTLPARSSSIVDLTAAVVESAQNDRYRHGVLLKFSRSACTNSTRCLDMFTIASAFVSFFFSFLFFFAVKIGPIVDELSDVLSRRISYRLRINENGR